MNLTGAKFKIRSVKEREEEFRSIKVNKEESSRIHPCSAPSLESDVHSKTASCYPKSTFENSSKNVRGRTEEKASFMSSRSKSLDWRGARRQESEQLQTVEFRDTVSNKNSVSQFKSEGLSDNPHQNNLSGPSKRLSKVNTTKKTQLSVFSEKSPINQNNSDSGRSPPFNVRGRTQWRTTSASTRSKSVEWKKTKSENQRETQTEGNQDSILLNKNHLKISDKNDESNSLLSNKLIKSPNRISVQLDVIKQPIIPEMEVDIRKKSSFAEGEQNNVRGWREWRHDYTSNSSKSLDWRVGINKGQNQSVVNTDTIEFGDNSKIESNFSNTNDLGSPRNRKPINLYKCIPEGCDSNKIKSSAVSGTACVELAKETLAQESSLQTPSSKLWQKNNSTDEGKHKLSMSGPLSEKKENNFSSHIGEFDTKETTGKETTDARSKNVYKDSILAKNVFTKDVVVCSSDIMNSNLKLKKTNDSSVEWSSSLFTNKKGSSYALKKGDTFPKTFSKELGTCLNSYSDASTSLSAKENTLSQVSPISSELHSVFSQTGSSKYCVTQTKGSIGLGTISQDIARNKYSASAISGTDSLKSVYDNTHGNRLERQISKMTGNVSQVKDTETTKSEQMPSPLEGVTVQTKTHLFPSITTDSKNQKILEVGVSDAPEDFRKKFTAPSLDSVRDKIHKFEALFQQSQNNSYSVPPKRTLSVVDAPKVMTGVSKSYSDRYLSLPRDNRERRLLKQTNFLSSQCWSPDKNEPCQIPTDKEKSVLQTSSSKENNLEFAVAHPMNLEDSISDGHNKDSIRVEVKTSTANKHMDEPDQFSHLIQKGKSMETNKVRHYLDDPMAQKCDNKLNDTTVISYVNPKNVQAMKSTTVFPNESVTTSVNFKSAFSPFNDLSTSGYINNVGNTIANKKAVAKVSRWIMGKEDGFNAEDGDDDDDDDDDDDGTEKEDNSDSGDSSITITSNLIPADHKSFSVSFVELCSLGGLEDLPPVCSGLKDEETWINKKTSSISSDVSALSCVSLLGAEELDSLLEDVKGLGDDALQNYEDIQVVVLHKDIAIGLGFTVAGGVDQNKPVTVHRVLPHGVAAQEGSIREGDYVLSINGTALHSSTHKEALNTLKRARKRSMAVVVVRRGDIAEMYHCTKNSPHTVSGKTGSRVQVTLLKSSSDLGFSLKGGVGSSLGDEPLTVQRLFHGGPVGQVFPGDELLKVGGLNLRGLRRLEAWNLIKQLPSGPVEVVLQRSYQYHSQ